MSTHALRDVTGAEAHLRHVFGARSIAIVGASGRPGALSWWPLHLLRQYEYTGDIYPVNPQYDELDGVPCYPSIEAVPGPVDLAVVAVKAARVPDMARACAAAGVRTVVIPAQGLGESGPDGKDIERSMISDLRAQGVRVAGPNADGLGCIPSGTLATIQPLFENRFRDGPLGLVTQSGATAGSLLKRLHDEGLGCRYYASTGNEADLGIEDYISYMVQDPEVAMVLAFVESIRRPKLFRRVADMAVELGKQIALIKVGRSEQGARRAAAHTGALAGSDVLYDAFLSSLNVIRVHELSELVAVTKLYLSAGRPRSRGLGILSVSGGQAGAIADVVVHEGLTVPELEIATRAALDPVLGHGAAMNPCDLTGAVATDPTLAARVYAAFSEQPDIGLVLYGRKMLTGTAGVDAARNLVAETGSRSRAPLAVYAMDGTVDAEEAKIYDAGGVATFANMHELCVAVNSIVAAGLPMQKALVADSSGTDTERALLSGTLDEPSAMKVLAAYDIPFPAAVTVSDADNAVAAARDIGFPVVLKVVSEGILHKSDAGGVALDLRNEHDVRRAFDGIATSVGRSCPTAVIDGYSVQEQIPTGAEIIAGVTVDEHLGPFVMVGLGGVFAELLRDVVFRPAPVSPARAREMVLALRGSHILQGFRGSPCLDVDALAAVISQLSVFGARHADVVVEAELNPIIVLPEGEGVRAADALIVCKEGCTS